MYGLKIKDNKINFVSLHQNYFVYHFHMEVLL